MNAIPNAKETSSTNYHYKGELEAWLTSVTVWLLLREGVAKSPCRCGSVSGIYKHRAKREEIKDFTVVRKLILDKLRPFAGCGASDASGIFFGAA